MLSPINFQRWMLLQVFNLKNSIFDSFSRSDNSFKKNQENEFAFYNRSARPEIESIRKFIEDATSRYPSSEVKELISRIRSGDDVHFKSALFELFLHEALLRQGCKLYPHPELPNGATARPDFLVVGSEGEEFYLEAVLATQKNELNKSSEAIKGIVFDSLSSSPHENFLVAIDDHGCPKTTPSIKKLKNKIHKWLDSLDPDEILLQIEKSGFDSVMPFRWNHDEWDLQIRPIPLKPERRGKASNLVGISGLGGGWLDSWTPIRDAVKYKGGKYGDLDKPLVVAVNLNSFHLDRIDEMQALFGQEQFVFQNNNAEPKMYREPNGAWYGVCGAQYRRVSAAWIFNDLNASSLASRTNTVYFNPWANIKIPNCLKCFPHAIAESTEMRFVDGMTFRQVFSLPEGWPENRDMDIK